jgi:dTDP-glucose 4,6-dehydratase
MSKKILSLGTGGFVLSNFIRKAVKDKESYEFIGVDKITNTSALNTVLSNQNNRFYMADAKDSYILNNIFDFERPEICLFGAENTSIQDSISNTKEFMSNSINCIQTVIDACLKYNIKLIYLSDDNVYGQLNSEQEDSFTESSPLNPNNPFAISKTTNELLIKTASNKGLKYNIIRSCNNYGPRQSKDKFIPKVIKCILNNENIPIYGKGNNIRSWIHVQDHCSAILKIIKDGKDNEIYNVADGQEFSNLEVVYEICKIMEKGTELISFVEDKPLHDFRYSMDNKKLKELGWEPEFKFKKTGLQHTILWMKNNAWWLR